MNADTPRNCHRRRGPLPRSTDYARLLLHRAQLALAALAVPVAVAVGIAATGADRWEPDSVVTTAERQLVSDLGIDPLTAAPGTVGALARAEAIAHELPSAGSDVGTGNGLLAGLGTLGSCWALLVAAGAIWRRRLVERDLRGWSDGWARVEPLWSDRFR